MRARALAAAALGALVLLAACFRPGAVVTRGAHDGMSSRGGILYRDGVPFSGIVREVYPNGAVRLRESYRHGKRHGKSLEYYASGKTRCYRRYHNGLKVGRHSGWWENGRKMFEFRFHRGAYLGTTREWYENGAPARQMHYVRGVESGMQRAWRPNGTLYANYEVRDGRRYGIVNARMCYSVKDGAGVFHAGR